MNIFLITTCVLGSLYMMHIVFFYSTKSTLQKNLSINQDLVIKLQKELQECLCDKERIQAAYTRDQSLWEEHKASNQHLEKKWHETFENITHKMLRMSEQNLMKNVQTSLAAQDNTFQKLEQSLKESLVQLSSRIGTLSKDHSTLDKTLQEHKTLFLNAQHSFQGQAEKLIHALKTPHIRGQWGEVQLKRIIELSGMTPHCDFSQQHTFTSDDGKTTIRPDVLIKLPENRHIIIDAKAPLGHYLDGIEDTDLAARNKKMLLHAKQIWSHVTLLSQKKYWEHFNSPDFVVLFLPGEPFLSTALEQDPSLLERASEQSIIIATPTTLMALLKAVHYGWRNMQIAENMQHILEVSSTLLQRTDAFSQHFQKIGQSLSATNAHFNKAVSSFESRLLPSARKLQSLGARTQEKNLDITPVHDKPNLS